MLKSKILKTTSIIAASLILASCGEIIDSGHRGVKKTFGKVEQRSLLEGFHWYNPFTTSIKEVDIRIKKITLETKVYTKDVQQADVEYVLNASLEPSMVHALYSEYGVRGSGVASGDLQSKVILPIASAAVKAVMGKWNATDIISNRQKVTEEVAALVKVKLNERYISVANIEVTKINYADKFEKAVEDKVVAIQKAQEAKNNTVRIKEEANQKIISAKAEAESMRIRARALSSNKGLVEYEAVQKWDGKLPIYTGGAMPFIKIKN